VERAKKNGKQSNFLSRLPSWLASTIVTVSPIGLSGINLGSFSRLRQFRYHASLRQETDCDTIITPWLLCLCARRQQSFVCQVIRSILKKRLSEMKITFIWTEGKKRLEK
jgi:hypothetical protein